ncbi:hypothetical protein GCM10011369_06220 [Neiella marina]|uniref:Uncharacterized protein n=2 Tax=Neiella marina TaxID=508461 RepID=A0A8J2U2Q6_9GAMM|nr:hypothetical protein [Neiella marina]GGA67312.1 hypothetical protein GCM10011369_06220 [Neiella marina]
MDPRYGEDRFGKQHHWKNGFHSLEHALISYIGLQQLRGQPIILYFALPQNSPADVNPYYFKAAQVTSEAVTNSTSQQQKQRYQFSGVTAR